MTRYYMMWDDLECGAVCCIETWYLPTACFVDILRSKRTLGWRTCLIVPELTGEIMAYKRHRTERTELLALRREQFLLESKGLDSSDTDTEAVALTQRLHFLRAEIRTKLVTYNRVFHPKWGPLFRAGFQESRFALQVSQLFSWNCSDYADENKDEDKDLLSCMITVYLPPPQHPNLQCCQSSCRTSLAFIAFQSDICRSTSMLLLMLWLSLFLSLLHFHFHFLSRCLSLSLPLFPTPSIYLSISLFLYICISISLSLSLSISHSLSHSLSLPLLGDGLCVHVHFSRLESRSCQSPQTLQTSQGQNATWSFYRGSVTYGQ